jgi:hypothetical protein
MSGLLHHSPLGHRWLCCGGGAFIFGPSGLGKSVLTLQAAVECACAQTAFGIKPARTQEREAGPCQLPEHRDCQAQADMLSTEFPPNLIRPTEERGAVKFPYEEKGNVPR